MTGDTAATPWYQRTIIGFDTETTGVDTAVDRIVTATVASVPLVGDPTIHTWLADPGIEIPESATKIHGITTEHARAHGREAAEVVDEICEALATLLQPEPGEPSPALVIYNAPFDHSILEAECRRHGVGTLAERAEAKGLPVFTVDPLVIDKAANRFVKGKGQRQLTPTCARYGITLTGAHDATADVLASVALARAIGARVFKVGHAPLGVLQGWQRTWYRTQTLGFADYLRKLSRGHEDAEERLALKVKADGVMAEAEHWPVRLVPVSYS
jgi:DNA polymerase-3 subunit epsilon